jgi:formylglycine-generating enzyme required for sulfatase activity
MAASAGTKTTCFFGNVGDEYWFTGDHTLFLDRYAWFNKNSNSRTHEVMKKQGNPLGLYDVYGNVQEWVLSESGHFYLAKGGSFNSGTDEISSFTRTKSKKGVGSPYVGFRLVKEEDK